MSDMSQQAAAIMLDSGHHCHQCGMDFVSGRAPQPRRTEKLICPTCGLHYWCSMPEELKKAHQCRCGIEGEIRRW